MAAWGFRGNRLKIRREAVGLTQVELAQRVDAGQNQIYRYEKGESEPSAEVLARLASELQVTSDWLLGLVDDETQHLQENELSPREWRLITALRDRNYPEFMRIAGEETA